MKWVIATSLFLVACTPMQFANVSSQNTLVKDKYDCEVQLGLRGHMGGTMPTDQLAYAMVAGRDDLTECLQHKGWKRVN
jgi:hypothetical protein